MPFDVRLIENLATITSITLLLGFVALGPIGRAIARKIEGRTGEALADAERAELGARLSQSEARLLELEERLDFTERLLARQHEAERLPDGMGRA